MAGGVTFELDVEPSMAQNETFRIHFENIMADITERYINLFTTQNQARRRRAPSPQLIARINAAGAAGSGFLLIAFQVFDPFRGSAIRFARSDTIIAASLRFNEELNFGGPIITRQASQQRAEEGDDDNVAWIVAVSVLAALVLAVCIMLYIYLRRRARHGYTVAPSETGSGGQAAPHDKKAVRSDAYPSPGERETSSRRGWRGAFFGRRGKAQYDVERARQLDASPTANGNAQHLRAKQPSAVQLVSQAPFGTPAPIRLTPIERVERASQLATPITGQVSVFERDSRRVWQQESPGGYSHRGEPERVSRDVGLGQALSPQSRADASGIIPEYKSLPRHSRLQFLLGGSPNQSPAASPLSRPALQQSQSVRTPPSLADRLMSPPALPGTPTGSTRESSVPRGRLAPLFLPPSFSPSRRQLASNLEEFVQREEQLRHIRALRATGSRPI